jgi:2'-5' RNA ligase
MDQLRTFIAVELDEQIKNELFKITNVLKSTQADVKWVEIENLHITLKFLGSVSLGKIERIIQVLTTSLLSLKPFSLTLNCLGVFPKITYPRVIWVDALTTNNQLENLAKMIEDNLVSLHFAKEKRQFQSHITIGRLRSNKNKQELINLIQNTPVEKKQMIVKNVTLFKSILSSKGPHYEKLSTFDLNG